MKKMISVTWMMALAIVFGAVHAEARPGYGAPSSRAKAVQELEYEAGRLADELRDEYRGRRANLRARTTVEDLRDVADELHALARRLDREYRIGRSPREVIRLKNRIERSTRELTALADRLNLSRRSEMAVRSVHDAARRVIRDSYYASDSRSRKGSRSDTAYTQIRIY